LPHFVDTNVIIYAYSGESKAVRADRVLNGATISVQVLNEFANVALRKLGYDEELLHTRISSIRSKTAVIYMLDELTHDLARKIVFRYKLGFYDSALLAAALLADCETFYSEDMQDGLVVEGVLTIRNPFV
jgi:predicted nucleic acid-binding protein